MTTKPAINVADVALRKTGDGKGFEAEVGPFGQVSRITFATHGPELISRPGDYNICPTVLFP